MESDVQEKTKAEWRLQGLMTFPTLRARVLSLLWTKYNSATLKSDQTLFILFLCSTIISSILVETPSLQLGNASFNLAALLDFWVEEHLKLSEDVLLVL